MPLAHLARRGGVIRLRGLRIFAHRKQRADRQQLRLRRVGGAGRDQTYEGVFLAQGFPFAQFGQGGPGLGRFAQMLVQQRALRGEAHGDVFSREVQACRIVPSHPGLIRHHHAEAGNLVRHGGEAVARLSAEERLMRVAVVLRQSVPGGLCPFQGDLRLPQIRVGGRTHPTCQDGSGAADDVDVRDLPTAREPGLPQIQAAKQLIVVAIAVFERTDAEVIDPVDLVGAALDEPPFLVPGIELRRGRSGRRVRGRLQGISHPVRTGAARCEYDKCEHARGPQRSKACST